MNDLKDHPLLVAARNVQHLSSNLVIYSRLIKGIVEVSWYVFIHNTNCIFSDFYIRIIESDRQPLKATDLKEWLHSRGLFLECLCPLVHDILPHEPWSCRLIESSTNGEVFALCHLEFDGCGMNGQ